MINSYLSGHDSGEEIFNQKEIDELLGMFEDIKDEERIECMLESYKGDDAIVKFIKDDGIFAVSLIESIFVDECGEKAYGRFTNKKGLLSLSKYIDAGKLSELLRDKINEKIQDDLYNIKKLENSIVVNKRKLSLLSSTS